LTNTCPNYACLTRCLTANASRYYHLLFILTTYAADRYDLFVSTNVAAKSFRNKYGSEKEVGKWLQKLQS